MTAAAWVATLAVFGVIALLFFRLSGEVDQRATEEDEVKQEQEHLLRVNVWVQDTSANATVPDSAGRPAPTSVPAKRIWAISRMLVDRALWEREILERHDAKGYASPAAWGTPQYWGNARAHPEVGTYLEGRAAAIAEMQKTSAAWMEARTAALARESGLPVQEIRDIFPGNFADVTPDEARLANLMLEMHRHLVRVDPRVHHAGGTELRWEREDDLRRAEELVARLNDAETAARQARDRWLAAQMSAFARVIQ
jgi:hypothetical protein